MTLWLPWIWFVLFGLMWLLIAGSNLKSLIEARRQGGTTSFTLFLGGFFGLAAVLACPLEGAWMWFWLPMLLDPGSLPAIFHLVRTRWKGKKP